MKSVAFLTVIIAFLSVSYALDDNELNSCEFRQDLRCGRQIHIIFRDSPFITEETLANNCSDIEENFQCLEDYIRECERESLDDFLLYFTSPRIVLAELCTANSPLRIAYREHVSCLRSIDMRNIPEQVLGCLESLDDSEIEAALEDARATSDTPEILCLLYGPTKNCLKELVTEFCDSETGDLLEELLDRTTQLPREKICTTPILTEVENLAENVVDFVKKRK